MLDIVVEVGMAAAAADVFAWMAHGAVGGLS